MTMKAHFPTGALLVEAPVFDVAGVMLELLAAKRLHGQEVVTSWAEEYGRESTLVLQPLSEAWSWLEHNGFIATELSRGVGPRSKFVTRAGRQVKSRSDFLAYAKESLLPHEVLREDLAAIVRPLFLSGHFNLAASTAFIQLEIIVRKAAGLPNGLVGTQLMRKAFQPAHGPLSDLASAYAEQQDVSDLFSGAIGYYKNPLSHREVGISSAVQAASMILLANELIVVAGIHARLRDERLQQEPVAAETPTLDEA